GGEQQRQRHGAARGGRRGGDGIREEDGDGGAARGDAARFADAGGAGVQPEPAPFQQRADADGGDRQPGPGGAEADFWERPERGGGGEPDDHRVVPGGHREPG